MKDVTGRQMTATEVAEWRAMNEDNERATNGATTPSEYVTARATEVARKFGRVWQSS